MKPGTSKFFLILIIAVLLILNNDSYSQTSTPSKDKKETVDWILSKIKKYGFPGDYYYDVYSYDYKNDAFIQTQYYTYSTGNELATTTYFYVNRFKKIDLSTHGFMIYGDGDGSIIIYSTPKYNSGKTIYTDLFSININDEAEENLQARFTKAFQHLKSLVKPFKRNEKF